LIYDKRIPHRIAAMFLLVNLMYQMEKVEFTGMDSGLYELQILIKKLFKTIPLMGVFYFLFAS